MSGQVLGGHNWGCGVEWVEAEGTATHPGCTGWAPPAKNDPASNVHGATEGNCRGTELEEWPAGARWSQFKP